MPSNDLKIKASFWKRVERTPTCWLWIGASTVIAGHRYGVLWVGGHNGRNIQAARFSLEIATGVQLTRKDLVFHICEHELCVNPEHLYAANSDVGALIPAAERFWSKVDKDGPIPEVCPELGPCWLWIGGGLTATRSGYGAFTSDGRAICPHRWSYEYEYKTMIPEGLQVCHKCDVRNCVRPTHLFIGTRVDNMQDALMKGKQFGAFAEKNGMNTHPERRTHGSSHPMAKLTEDDIRKIRRLYGQDGLNAHEICRIFPVSPSNIYLILRGVTWSHVSE